MTFVLSEVDFADEPVKVYLPPEGSVLSLLYTCSQLQERCRYVFRPNRGYVCVRCGRPGRVVPYQPRSGSLA